MKKLHIFLILIIAVITVFAISATQKRASATAEEPAEAYETRRLTAEEAEEYKADLINRINPDSESYDPYNLARICVYLDNGGDILEDEKAENIGILIEAAHIHFVEDPEYARKCYEKVKPTVDCATITLQYSSAQEPQ